MGSIGSFMTSGVNKILFAFEEVGKTAAAVFGVYKLQSFVFMPVFGLNNCMVPIVSYNYGAKRPDRITQTIRLSALSMPWPSWPPAWPCAADPDKTAPALRRLGANADDRRSGAPDHQHLLRLCGLLHRLHPPFSGAGQQYFQHDHVDHAPAGRSCFLRRISSRTPSACTLSGTPSPSRSSRVLR